MIKGLGDVDCGAPDGLAEPLVVVPLLRKVGHQAVHQRRLAEIHVERGNPFVPVVEGHFLSLE